MNFNEYQHAIGKTWAYPDAGNNLLYPALGLAGEAGEVADKIKKWWRNEGITSAGQLSEDKLSALILELGDCQWYLAAFAKELKVALELIAERNIEKTHGRLERGTVKGEGDNR